jgi:hypothetical protein
VLGAAVGDGPNAAQTLLPDTVMVQTPPLRLTMSVACEVPLVVMVCERAGTACANGAMPSGAVNAIWTTAIVASLK